MSTILFRPNIDYFIHGNLVLDLILDLQHFDNRSQNVVIFITYPSV